MQSDGMSLGTLIMDFDRAVLDLSSAMAEQLQGQLTTLMAQAQARIADLERELLDLQQRHLAVVEELRQERQARAAVEHDVQTIHEAIAAQVELAEAEQAAEMAAEAERERRWSNQLQALQQTLLQERQQHYELQQRLQTLRRAASDLFSLEMPWSQPSSPHERPQPLVITGAE